MSSDIIIYKNPDGSIKIDVRLEEENVWLTQDPSFYASKFEIF